jgi:hypothetical protein
VKKHIPLALTLATFTMVGAAPALAQTGYYPAPGYQYYPGRYYMYAPGYNGYTAGPTAPDFTPYPNPIQRSGTQANRAQWDPSFVPTAPY